jgi:hypothetical protein
MRLTGLIVAIFLFMTLRAHAISSNLVPPGADQCRAAILAAERGHAIPPRLLAAIGRVESGRKDPGTGSWGPWPWTINAEGTGTFFDTKAEAIAAVTRLHAQGVRSIDVGCMQVNLMHHPNAFASLEQAFDPSANADYAARFLDDLHNQTNDWMAAVARYHSANPAEGAPYAARVAAAWPDEQRLAGTLASGLGASMPQSALNPIMPIPSHQPPRLLDTTGGAKTGMAAAAGTGHGLAFYWAAPIRAHPPARIPYLAALR